MINDAILNFKNAKIIVNSTGRKVKNSMLKINLAGLMVKIGWSSVKFGRLITVYAGRAL